jgi:hypothetical protein
MFIPAFLRGTLVPETNSAGHNGLVDPRERKLILGEGGIGPEDPREIARRKALEADLEGSPLRGRPLPRRLRAGFSPSVDRVVASLGGPLPYMVRLREIEAQTRQHLEALARRRQELVEEAAADAERFAREWQALARRWSFAAVNDLIDRHNRFYPAESQLPMDPRRGDFVLVNGKPYDLRPLDADWILERFPAELQATASAA